METQTLKYLALGILVGYLTPYLVALIKKPIPTSETASLKEKWNSNT